MHININPPQEGRRSSADESRFGSTNYCELNCYELNDYVPLSEAEDGLQTRSSSFVAQIQTPKFVESIITAGADAEDGGAGGRAGGGGRESGVTDFIDHEEPNDWCQVRGYGY